MVKERIYFVTTKNQTLIDQYISVRRALKKSNVTIKNEYSTLQHLGDFLGEKTFEQVVEEDLQSYFNAIDNFGTRDIKGLRIIQFYRWLFKLERKEKPKVMKWFEYSTSDQRDKVKDPDVKKYLITPEEYQTIITASGDAHGMWQALWETYHLSGGRLGEVYGMKIQDVIIADGNVSVRLVNSKTKPREVPLPENPNLLLRWINNHPLKDNPDSPLWVSYSPSTYLQHLGYSSIQVKFDTIRQHTNIKNTVSVHCFRKTRATIMFSARTKDGGKIYDDKEIGQFFGWKPHTVSERREQYDLRNMEDLKEKIFGTTTGRLETYDTIKQEKELLEQKHGKEIERLNKEIDEFKIAQHDLIKQMITLEKVVAGLDKE